MSPQGITQVENERKGKLCLQERPADEEHLALLGPLLRAEVGDKVIVVLKNNLDFTINFEPHGLMATSKTYDLLTKPNATEVYEFSVPEQVHCTHVVPCAPYMQRVWLFHSLQELFNG